MFLLSLAAFAAKAATVTSGILASSGTVGTLISGATTAVGTMAGTAAATATATVGISSATSAALGTITAGGTTTALNVGIIEGGRRISENN